MKYSIYLNQWALSQTKLDIKEACILEYLRGFCETDDKRVKQLTFSEDGRDCRYTWINFKHLFKEMPLLGIKQKASISKRIKNIEDEGFIKTFRAPDGSLYVRLLAKIKELSFMKETVNNYEQGVSENEAGVLADTNSTSNTLSKQNINNISEVASAPSYNSFLSNLPSGLGPKNPKDPRIKDIMNFFFRNCIDIKNFKPLVDGADAKMIQKRLGEGHTVDEIKEELIWFLESESSRKLTPSLKTGLSTAVYNTYLSKNAF